MSGLEIHWPRDATEWAAWAGILVAIGTMALAIATSRLARTTDEEMQLLRDQASALKTSATTGAEQLMELRESRFAELLPMLRWQSPVGYVDTNGSYVDSPELKFQMHLRVYLTNEGPGPARIKRVSVTTDTGEPVTTPGMTVPSTLPSNERIIFFAYGERVAAFEYRPRTFTIRLVYCDLLGEFDYETVAVIRAEMAERVPSGESGAQFIDSDERSALERRLPKV